ncbi:glycosyltransferase family 61 protein [Leptolyngbya sp. AN02str]|uniref:glycosyltransferase family 61 protein n=1 Tax=Leptolyngbya sp. AN02str TaxID=3423363 RepID=UPI003D31CD88
MRTEMRYATPSAKDVLTQWLSTFQRKSVETLKQVISREQIRKNIFASLWQWFGLRVTTREDMIAKPEMYRLQEFGEEFRILPSMPYMDAEDAVPDIIHTLRGGFTLRKPFVAEVPNAYLVGPTAVGLASDRSILMETVMPNSDRQFPSFEALPLRTLSHRSLRSPTIELDTACSLVNGWGRKVYAHWLAENLTRLEGLERYQQRTGIKPTLLVHAQLKSWQKESLALLGYQPEDYVPWTGGIARVNRLVVPSFRRQARWSDPSAYQWMRDRMIHNLPSVQDSSLPYSSRIFISRGNASGRRIVNEEDVMQLLSPLGFKKYVLEELTFSEEVRLFSQAEAIVGIHGSGLVNMIFSTKKPVIIDLFSAFFTGSFFQLTSSLQFPYACLFCEPVGPQSKQGDIIVNLEKLERLIHTLKL